MPDLSKHLVRRFAKTPAFDFEHDYSSVEGSGFSITQRHFYQSAWFSFNQRKDQ